MKGFWEVTETGRMYLLEGKLRRQRSRSLDILGLMEERHKDVQSLLENIGDKELEALEGSGLIRWAEYG